MPKSKHRKNRRKAIERVLPKQPQVGEGPSMGSFEAPCGDTIVYFNEVKYEKLIDYRLDAVADHVLQGDCLDPVVCSNALNEQSV